MSDDAKKYMQAVNRQKWNTAPNRVVLVERLPECYRLTTAVGETVHMDLEWGLKNYPIALCGIHQPHQQEGGE